MQPGRHRAAPDSMAAVSSNDFAWFDIKTLVSLVSTAAGISRAVND